MGYGADESVRERLIGLLDQAVELEAEVSGRGELARYRARLAQSQSTSQPHSIDEASQTEFLGRVLDALPDAIFVKDDQHRWVLTNSAFCRFVGYSADELLGKSDFDFFPEQEARVFWAKDDEVLRTMGDNLNEETVTNAKGDTHVIQTKKTAFETSDGRKLLIGAFRDVTELRRIEAELRKTHERLEATVRQRTAELSVRNEQLRREIDERRHAEQQKEQAEAQLRHQQKMDAVGNLASGVAHDFNNLLTIIVGQSSMLANSLPGESPHGEAVAEICEAAERAAELTHRLLALGRRSAPPDRQLQLDEVVGGMHKLLSRLLGERIALTTTTQGSVPKIVGNVSMLEQVVLNLVLNSRDAIAKTGTVQLELRSAELTEDDCLTRPGCQPGNYVLLRCTDDGEGMTDETVGKVFEPYFTTRQHRAGAGLGLSTVYGIIKQHRGFIDVNSEPGAGTVVDVYLPTRSNPAGTRELSRQLAGRTVMLVEDERAVRRVAEKMLESLGVHVVSCDSAESALEHAARGDRAIDALITDVVMPGIQGPELAQMLRAQFPGLSVILASGYAEAADYDGLQFEFLQKPFQRERLGETLLRLLRPSATPQP